MNADKKQGLSAFICVHRRSNFLEKELQAKLHNPCATCADGGDGSQISSASLIEIAIHQHEVRMVEDVENFPPELDTLPLGHGPILLQAQVDGRQAGSVHIVSPAIAIREGKKAVLIGC